MLPVDPETKMEALGKSAIAMKKLHFLVSLTTKDNDYQIEQAKAAVETTRRLGVNVEVLYAENDSITQSQQLLKAIQSPAEMRPDAIILEPVGGTGLPHVARAAVSAGMGWVVLNCDVDYIPELRRIAHAPVFNVSTNHLEVGRIQGRQIAILAPSGRTVLYIHGPSRSLAARQRMVGMQETKPEATKIIVLKAQWTEESSYRAVSSWMLLSTSQTLPIDMIAAQDDSMAMGARKAFQEHGDATTQKKWLSLPFTGVDGLPTTGQEYVRRGLLAATIVTPPVATRAIEILVEAIQRGSQPAEVTMAVPVSCPPIAELAKKRR
jgi:ribose transport system substrate-binding protein